MSEPIRVLHADDDPEVADLVATFLERSGFEVVTAGRAAAALDRVREGGVDCVVSDYEMPGTDGLELLAAVRETHPELPFVLFTARGSEAVASEAISAGVTDYLQKETAPEQFEVLVNRVENAVSAHRMRERARRAARALGAAMDGMAIVAGGEYTYVNEAYAALHGYDDPAAMVGMHWRDCYADAEVERIETEVLPAARAEGSWRGEAEGRSRDGTGFPQELALSVLDDDRLVWVVRDRSDRRAREVRFEALVEDASDVITVLDGDGTIRYQSPSIERVLGYDPAELVGEDVFDYVHPGDADEVLSRFRAAVDDLDRTADVVEYRFRHADGSWRWLEAAWNDRGNAVDGYVFNSRDVTGRKRVERALRESRDRLEALHRVSREISACDSETRVFELAVEAAETVMEFDICAVDAVDGDVLVPQALSSGTPEAGYYEATPVDAADNLAAEAYRTGRTSLVDDLASDGVEPAEESYRSALTVPVGDVGVFQAVSTEVGGFDGDDRRLAELLAAQVDVAVGGIRTRRELRGERDRFAALFRNIDEPAVEYRMVGEEPVVERVNPAFERTFGYDAGAVEGEPLDEFVVPADRETEAAELNWRVARGERLDVEVRRQTADGPREFLLRSAPIGSGDAVRGYSVYTDVTERRERERELQRQNERLEEFAGVVSHDLRNPLNVAAGSLQLYRESGQEDHLDRLARAHGRMERIIEDVLTLARGGRTVTDPGPVDLGTVVGAAWSAVETGGADLRADADLSVRADPSRLQRLLENLFQNAVEHAGPGVTVTVGPLDDGRGFFVVDDGPGLPAGDHESAFESGYSTAEAGTGFGLAIVRRLAAAHGWSVRATGGEAGGARFEVSGVAVEDGSG